MATTTFSGPVVSENGFVTSDGITAAEIAVTGDSDLLGTANVIIIPTSDPGVAGAIWFDTPDLKISAGA